MQLLPKLDKYDKTDSRTEQQFRGNSVEELSKNSVSVMQVDSFHYQSYLKLLCETEYPEKWN